MCIYDQYFKLSGLFNTQVFLYREVWNARW